DLPTANAFQVATAGGHDAFVAELSATGQTLLYSSYLGGSGDDFAREIAVDPSGNAYVVGFTNSFDYPEINAAQGNLGGTPGTAIVFSTYLGGSGYDEADDVTVDAAGVPTVAGFTGSANFPLVNAQQTTYGGGSSDGFVARYDPSGKPLSYSSFIGGNGQDGV